MKKNRAEIREFDVAELLDTENKIVAYLNAELAEGDPHYIKVALQTIARARNMNMTEIAKKAQIPRATVHRALSINGNPEYTTMQKVIEALDLQMMVVPKGARLKIS
jgi:probable addiction module antidote protein